MLLRPLCRQRYSRLAELLRSRQQTFVRSLGHEVDLVSHDDKSGFGIVETQRTIAAGGIQISRDNTTVYKIVLLGDVWPESQLSLGLAWRNSEQYGD